MYYACIDKNFLAIFLKVKIIFYQSFIWQRLVGFSNKTPLIIKTRLFLLFNFFRGYTKCVTVTVEFSPSNRVCTAQCTYQICIYIYTLLVCLSFCLFVSNKRQNDWTDWAKILCGIWHDPGKGVWMLRIQKLNPNGFNICEILKLLKKVFKNQWTFLLLFYTVQKEDCCRIETRFSMMNR